MGFEGGKKQMTAKKKPGRKKGPPGSGRYKEMPAALLESGNILLTYLPVRVIAPMYGVSLQTVYSRIKEGCKVFLLNGVIVVSREDLANEFIRKPPNRRRKK